MNELKIFEHPRFGDVRTITENGRTLFCGKDVAAALGYKNPSKALSDHCKGVTKRYTPTASGRQEMNFIPEGDVYRLAAKSELPGADEFESWIFDEVLPALRRFGSYTLSGCIPTRPLTSDDYADAAKTISKCPGNRLLIVLSLYRKAGLDIQMPPMAGWMYPEQMSLFPTGNPPGFESGQSRTGERRVGA